MIGLEPLPQRSMRGVMKNVSFFFEIVVFILLGYSLSVPLIEGDPSTETIAFIIANPGILTLGLLTAVLVILVARPISVFIVTAGDRTMGFKERFFLSWAGIKGVASAALAAIAVTVIIHYSSEPSFVTAISTVVPTIYAIVFIVLLVSLVVQGLTTSFFANFLGLTEKQDRAQEITVHRDATRKALLSLVDQYTEGNIETSMYSRLKSELEEEIFNLEDELRRVVSERRARVQELGVREDICKTKLNYYEEQFNSGKISEGVFQDLKSELEAEIEELANRISMQKQGMSSEDDAT
jgi:NhaP-type Na+/H+ or K+/H+ antiporter